MGIPMPKPYAFTKQQMYQAWRKANHHLIEDIVKEFENNLQKNLSNGLMYIWLIPDKKQIELFVAFLKENGWPIIGSAPTYSGLRHFSDEEDLYRIVEVNSDNSRGDSIKFRFSWTKI